MKRLSCYIKKLNILIIFLIGILSLTSCVNEDKQLGLDLVKSNGGMDILSADGNIATLNSMVYTTDSLETLQNDNFVLGTYKDSYFGKVQTSIYTSLSLEDNSGQDFSNIGTIDSAVLCLAYSMVGAYSEDTSKHEDNFAMKVYLLSSAMDSTSKYAFSEIETESEPIFNQTIVCSPLKGIMLEGDTIDRPPHMRMPLNDKFLNKLKQGVYPNQSSFAEDFKGIKITAQSSSQKFLASINMKSSNTGIFVYYHDANGNKGSYMINFTSTGYRFMHIDKDFTSSSLRNLNNTNRHDTIKTQDYIYLASLGIAEACLDLKGIDTWYNTDSVKGAAFNRAELILPVADMFNKSHMFPGLLQAYRKQDGKYFLLSDELATNNWLGNKYDARIKAYRLDITSFLQNYVMGRYDNCQIYLIPDGRISTASRVVLNGASSTNPPKLNIIYSHPATN